ncbi:MAG: hypothetical protein INR62_09690, partial [Rhodospirillales bacterium]|nr:hypothetical protein [Acetobacter sp.]
MKERLATSAAFQQELQRRQAAPPTDVHPAFRSRSVSNPLIQPPPARDSDCTQITDFMKAAAEDSPKLQLKATPSVDCQPTFRARIEERNEQEGYELSGNQEERVPVFHPTPKMPATKDFAPPPRAATALGSYEQEGSSSKMPVKTPKKSFFSKLKLSANSRTSHLSVGNLIEDPANQADEKLPVKAQAVLGDSPRKPKGRVSLGASPTKLPRSPSKRKNFFSRKNADATSDTQRPHTSLSENQRPPNTPSTVISDGPHTAISDPAHYSYQDRQAHLKHRSGEKKEGAKEVQKTFPLGRSQSVNLRYFDGGVPPTPPAKNTPPHEKAANEAKEIKDMHDAIKLPPRQRERTPGDGNDGAILSTTDRISPTKFGNYGYRDAPTLVTKPSMYSMHASVVPDMMEATTLKEMNARVGALDLEGFSTPAENNAAIRRSRIAEAVYSPSVYSTEWGTRSPAMGLGATPMLKGEELRASNTPSAHTKDSSSNGTIPIFYPDLATDPSVKTAQQSTPNKKQLTPGKHATTSSPVRGRTHLSPSLAVHNRTHSRDHLPDTEDNGKSNEQSLFAHHIEHDQRQRHAGLVNSPSTFSHASAMPSPLQYLPATTYTPPQKMKVGKGKAKEEAVGSQADRVPNFS